jgi:signal transduction histidine kinase
VIQDLARGVKKAHGMVDMESFVNQFLLARISCRLIASQQIITQDFKFGMNNDRNGGIDLHTMPAHTIRRCSNIVQTISDRVYGTHPNIKIMGHMDSTLAYVPAHLEYMVNEILKNAVRATMDRQVALKIKEGGKGASIQDALDAVRRGGADEVPKIRCVISKGKRFLSIKISDTGGGVEEEDIRDIWK